MLSGLIFCLVGFAINIADVSIGAKYFGTFLVVAGAYAGFPGVVAWCVSPPSSRASVPREYGLWLTGWGGQAGEQPCRAL